ncbi:uncharacterized protein LOC122812221 [Protopterus annectens]|uniref:uncharacterized protein LOC122812221 n=1 Tax=Protopterus annectens TaxID=7888 RepID=UPI001CFB3DF0|nr:uncharacterized protein LOC122812221 [Protopterus annectens]
MEIQSWIFWTAVTLLSLKKGGDISAVEITHHQGNRGQIKTISCRMNLPESKTYSVQTLMWHYSREFANKPHRQLVESKDRFSTSNVMYNRTVHLKIHSLKLSDAGFYYCTVSLRPTPYRMALYHMPNITEPESIISAVCTVHLSVQAPLQKIKISHTGSLVLKKTKNLTCMAEDFFPSNIQMFWQKNGLIQNDTSFQSNCTAEGTCRASVILKFQPQLEDDGQELVCKASHLNGSYSSVDSITIVLEYAPQNLSMGTIILEDDSLQIYCSAKSKPVASITIYQNNDTFLVHGRDSYVLIVLHPSEWKTGNIYTCIATNHLGTSNVMIQESIELSEGASIGLSPMFVIIMIVIVVLVLGAVMGLTLYIVRQKRRRRKQIEESQYMALSSGNQSHYVSMKNVERRDSPWPGSSRLSGQKALSTDDQSQYVTMKTVGKRGSPWSGSKKFSFRKKEENVSGQCFSSDPIYYNIIQPGLPKI